MTHVLRKVFALIGIICVLAACTRERPTPEPLALATAQLPALDGSGGVLEPAVDAPSGDASVAPAVDNGQAAPSNVVPTPIPDVTAVPTASSGTQTFQYTVVSGDTVDSIAAKYGITGQYLRDLNRLQNDYLQANQLLRVPLLAGYTVDGLPTPTPQPFVHVIGPGETLYGIATQYGIDATTLIATNNIQNPDGLIVGQSLAIPGYNTAPASGTVGVAQPTIPAGSGSTGADSGGFQVVHIVKPGEGLYAIAAQYGVSADEIATANNIQNYELLRVGQRLFVPGVTLNVIPSALNQRVHLVQPGEGLIQIAVIYGVSAQAISQVNNLTDSDLIYPGQQLIIPGQ